MLFWRDNVLAARLIMQNHVLCTHVLDHVSAGTNILCKRNFLLTFLVRRWGTYAFFILQLWLACTTCEEFEISVIFTLLHASANFQLSQRHSVEVIRLLSPNCYVDFGHYNYFGEKWF